MEVEKGSWINRTWPSVAEKLRSINAPEIAAKLFEHHYRNFASGSQGSFVHETQIQPVADVVDAETLDESYRRQGEANLDAVAVLKLNGGLGTGMGLAGPKSLLPVRGSDSFLSFILRQAQSLSVPLVLMNSFSTDQATREAIDALGLEDVEILSFLQHQVPKIDAESWEPVSWPADAAMEWCPPGHGDIYAALVTSGTLEKLLESGRRYVFVSNSDNLGATLDLAILGHFISSGSSFLMEVADRTAADKKGGHLARSADGGLLLRERAQCTDQDLDSFEDVDRWRYFNTNNLWLDLQAIQSHMQANEGMLVLPTIANRKTVDPKDKDSKEVFQLESAMGAAIEVLKNTAAIRVPRSRFAPVKTTGDLLSVRSDAYEVRQDASVGLVPSRDGVPPTVKLDSNFYKLVTDLDARIPIPPSLIDCNSLTIEGDVRLESGVTFQGDVAITSTGSNQLASGSYTKHVSLP